MPEKTQISHSSLCYRLFLIQRGRKNFIYSFYFGVSLVAQWLRIHLPMQGTWVRALIQENPTGHGATKPVHHNY